MMKYKVKNTGGKYIKTGRDTAYVTFTFGSGAYVGFNRYLGISREDCLRMRSDAIDGYIADGNMCRL